MNKKALKAELAETKKRLAEAEKTLEQKDEKLKEVQGKLEQLLNEFAKFKKRNEREIIKYRRFSNKDLLLKILPILDNLKLALKAEDGNNSFVRGIKAIVENAEAMLSIFNVTPIKSLGKPFNPEIHYALLVQEAEKFPENTVSDVLKEGYMYHGELLRAAEVVVSA